MGITRQYQCSLCGTKYTHDKAYTHFIIACQKKERDASKGQRA